MKIPRKRKRPKLGVRVSEKYWSPGHVGFVRGRECAISGKKGHVCSGRMEVHHEPTRGAGGDDRRCAPLCSAAHEERHRKGRKWFENHYGVNLEQVGKDCWQADAYHRRKYENKLKENAA